MAPQKNIKNACRLKSKALIVIIFYALFLLDKKQ